MFVVSRKTERLRLELVSPSAVDDLMRLVRDDHVRRYMMDGQLFDRAWAEARIRDSEELLATIGVGLELAYDSNDELVGFTGFLETNATGAPMLLYAVFERFNGMGFASEMGRAAIEAARACGIPAIAADVDEVNAVSVRVLEKLGFVRVGVEQGAFGALLLYRLELRYSSSPRDR